MESLSSSCKPRERFVDHGLKKHSFSELALTKVHTGMVESAFTALRPLQEKNGKLDLFHFNSSIEWVIEMWTFQFDQNGVIVGLSTNITSNRLDIFKRDYNISPPKIINISKNPLNICYFCLTNEPILNH